MESDSILQNTFHHSQFADKERLVKLKKQQKLRISLAFPTLNEEKTIGKEIFIIKTELMDRYPLLDEIVVIDSSSKDHTCQIAAEFGARVYNSKDIMPKHGSVRGKGDNLWKSLYVLNGDIIVWIDADIKNIHPKFVYGLVGPLLEHKHLSYVKAFYERPIAVGDTLQSGGGRVTEILVRPLFSIFYPELAQLIQPLSGEYASRRQLLEHIPFSVGYGVELGHLVDIYHRAGPGAFGQVDLDRRVHRNQSVAALSRMSFGIMHTFFNRLESYNHVSLESVKNRFFTLVEKGRKGYKSDKIEIPIIEREPIVFTPEYREKFYPQTAGRSKGWRRFLNPFRKY